MKTRINNNNNKGILGIFARYLLLLIIALFFSYSNILYDFLLKLTIYPLNALLNIFYSSSIIADRLFINNSISIELIPACIAISAYLLLIIINLTTNMSLKKRIASIAFSCLSFLIINIIRIFILSILLISNYSDFEIIHKFLWYFLSIFFVLAVWFLTAYIFKIKAIPIYSDILIIVKLTKQFPSKKIKI